jgi:hypothetical protein
MDWTEERTTFARHDCRFVNPPVMSFVSKCRCAFALGCLPEEEKERKERRRKKIRREIHDLKKC